MIKDLTQKTVIAYTYDRCDSFISRMFGLMFSWKPRALLMVFPTMQRIGIHMVFVFFPIDVAWLDDTRRIVALKKNLRPFSAITPKERAQFVIELPTGMIEASKMKAGDRIGWE